MLARRRVMRPYSGMRSALTRIAARQATRFMNNKFNKPRTAARKQTSSSNATDNPLTTQHDFKVDYRRRKRTRRLRRRIRRGKKFTRRVVNSYIRATESPKKVVKMSMFTRNCDTYESRYFACMLHTADGDILSPDNPQADWREFFIEGSTQNRRGWDELGNTVAPPVYPFVSERGRAIRCTTSGMELTIRNTGTTPALVNVYRVVCKKDWPFAGIPIEKIYEQGFERAGRVTEIDQPVEAGVPLGMWDPQMQPNQLTSTPFQSYLFVKLFTIYRRTKYQLAPGEEINLVLKDNRPKIVPMERVRNKSCVACLTHGYFVDFQGVPRLNEALGTETGPAQLSVQKMVRYNLTMMPEKRPATSYDVQDPIVPI